MIFKFYTNEACSNHKPTVKEIPCLVYSNDPKDKFKRDLSPLIKQTGWQNVSIYNILYVIVTKGYSINPLIGAGLGRSRWERVKLVS